MFKFSEAKNADEYSFGGEDGLDETPFIFENERLIYLGTPKWSDLSIYASKNISSDIILRFGLTNLLILIIELLHQEFQLLEDLFKLV